MITFIINFRNIAICNFQKLLDTWKIYVRKLKNYYILQAITIKYKQLKIWESHNLSDTRFTQLPLFRVTCDKFMGAHKHLPVFGIFNYVHCTLSWGGHKSCTKVQYHRPKLVIGNIHDRGMGFGGAHVWKTSHPQAMEFFRTQNLDPWGASHIPPPTLFVSNFLFHPSLMHK